MSGVILATAIGGTAVGTGALVAAGIGAGTTLYGGAKSFSDASKARKRGEAAQRAAIKAVEEAKKRIDINRMEQLSIAKEPYELMREAQLVQGATGMQAGVEGETRGAAATAGRIQMAQGQQQAGIRAAQAQQMDQLNKLIAQEDARIDQQLAGIAMTEAEGAQLAARDAEEDRANYIAQGVGTLGSIAQGLSSSYAEGNFGKIGQPNSKKMLSKKERAPFLAAEEEYDRMMAQRRADAGAFVPYEQELENTRFGELSDYYDGRTQGARATDPDGGQRLTGIMRFADPNSQLQQGRLIESNRVRGVQPIDLRYGFPDEQFGYPAGLGGQRIGNLYRTV